MARISFVIASICLLLLCKSSAASLVSCEQATAATINGSLILGTWYEAARKPIGGAPSTEQCIVMEIDHSDGNTSVQLTFSPYPDDLLVHQTVAKNIIYDPTDASADPQVFNALFNADTNGVNTVYKFLETDYSSYAFICGYLPNSANVDAGAFIITRDREVSFTALETLTAKAQRSFSDFDDLATVTQSAEC